MITLEFRDTANKWEEYKTFNNKEDLRQEINNFLYNEISNTFEEIYIYYWDFKKEKKMRSKVLNDCEGLK